MSTGKKSRYLAVGGIIVIVVILAIAFLSAGTTSKVVSVAEASQPDAVGQKIQVTGNVVDNSYKIEGNVLTFRIYDVNDPKATLPVSYDKGVAATFGNGVTAICTGQVAQDGTLQCAQLVTKCPSKYETATDALSVSRLQGYGDAIIDKPVKVQGKLKAGSLKGIDAKDRFVLVDEGKAADEMPVSYTGAIADTIGDGSTLVLTGSLDKKGTFDATVVAETQKG